MLTIKLQDSSHREKDANGFLIVRNNPIAKAGVFDYLLSEVEPSCKESEANKIVKVLRDWDMLKSVKDNFANKPIKDNHYWIGKNEDSNTADGAIGSVVSVDDEKMYLIADLFIYNPFLIEKIESGEAVELSPAYTSSIIKESGSFNGTPYQYKQDIKDFNHLAVVENGRSGKDLKIQDKGIKKMSFKDKMVSAFSRFLDSAEVETQDEDQEEVSCQDEDKREIIREIMAIAAKADTDFKGGENEKIETIAKLAEKLAYNPSEAKANDEDTESEATSDDSEGNSSTENQGSEQANVNVSELKTEILNEVAEAVNEAIVKAQDAAIKVQKSKEIAYQKVQDSIKAPFDYSKMSVSDIYRTGYESLSGKKMDKGLDSETAFIMASASASNTQTKVQDSTSTLNLSKFK